MTAGNPPTSRRFGAPKKSRNYVFHVVLSLISSVFPTIGQAQEALPTDFITLSTSLASLPKEVSLVLGGQAGDNLGGDTANGVAYGDIDGDGYDDIVTGSQFAPTLAGPLTGQAYIVFGDDGLPRSTVDFSDPMQSSGVIRILGASAENFFGRRVVCGDVNGDGFDDVIVAERPPFARKDSSPDRLTVLLGSADIRNATIIDLTNPQGTNGESRVIGNATRTVFGDSLACGDVNGDGFADIVVGAPHAESPFIGNGGVYVVYGAAVLDATIDLFTGGTLSPHGETRILGALLGEACGHSVATGDVNGDGYDDIIVGARGAAPGGRSQAGMGYLVYGGPTLPNSIVDLSEPAGTFGETRILGRAADDRFGFSAASGDIDRDGYDEMVFGANGSTFPSGENRGACYILRGSPLIAGATLDLSNPPGTHGEGSISGSIAEGAFGSTVACADVNGDGRDDVIVGAPFASNDAEDDKGLVYVVYGRDILLGSNRDLAVSMTFPDILVKGAQFSDQLASSLVAAGDVDRDGLGDFASGARFGRNPPIGGFVDFGYLANVFGYLPVGPPAPALVRERYREGGAPKRGVGGRMAPTSRTSVAFDAGSASIVSVTLTRSSATIENLGEGITTVGEVLWEVSTDRIGWTNAKLEFQYTDPEVVNLTESNLTIFSATSPSGPWTVVADQSVDATANIVCATVDSLGYFALADPSPAPPQGLRAAPGKETVRLFWDPNPEFGLIGYDVFRRAIGAPESENIKLNTDLLQFTEFIDGEPPTAPLPTGAGFTYQVDSVALINGALARADSIVDATEGEFVFTLAQINRDPNDDGEIFMPVSVLNARGIFDNRLLVQLYADPTFVDFQTLKIGETALFRQFNGMIQMGTNEAQSEVNVLITPNPGAPSSELRGEGSLFNLRFKSKDNTPEIQGVIELNSVQVDLGIGVQEFIPLDFVGVVFNNPFFQLGDLDGDSDIDLFDTLELRRIAIGKPLFDGQQKVAGDINGDGIMDVADLNLIDVRILQNKGIRHDPPTEKGTLDSGLFRLKMRGTQIPESADQGDVFVEIERVPEVLEGPAVADMVVLFDESLLSIDANTGVSIVDTPGGFHPTDRLFYDRRDLQQFVKPGSVRIIVQALDQTNRNFNGDICKITFEVKPGVNRPPSTTIRFSQVNMVRNVEEKVDWLNTVESIDTEIVFADLPPTATPTPESTNTPTPTPSLTPTRTPAAPTPTATPSLTPVIGSPDRLLLLLGRIRDAESEEKLALLEEFFLFILNWKN